mmetsp:Transcript_162/g.318  ORF Transcript_162/g.318 Transcript_162/m.318 type:complete len:223 (-) Transcript_162:79-747(-)
MVAMASATAAFFVKYSTATGASSRMWREPMTDAAMESATEMAAEASSAGAGFVGADAFFFGAGAWEVDSSLVMLVVLSTAGGAAATGGTASGVVLTGGVVLVTELASVLVVLLAVSSLFLVGPFNQSESSSVDSFVGTTVASTSTTTGGRDDDCLFDSDSVEGPSLRRARKSLYPSSESSSPSLSVGSRFLTFVIPTPTCWVLLFWVDRTMILWLCEQCRYG